jgi:DNA-binding transcriptional MerR regulator
MTEETLTPAEVRRMTGATRSALLWLEQKTVVKPQRAPHRTQQHRVYTAEQAELIRRLRYLQSRGMTLNGALAALPELEAWETRTGKTPKVAETQESGTPAR